MTAFYMMATLGFNELIDFLHVLQGVIGAAKISYSRNIAATM